MNYKDKKVAITGYTGFLGRAIERKLIDEGAVVTRLLGDTRDIETFLPVDHSFDYIFHFAAPSSQVLFKRNAAYCIESTLKGFMNAATAAKNNGARLIYPSTGLLSQNKSNEYARCKQICEDWAKGNAMDALGVRIFATYGPGEGHKADYASVPYLFARDIVSGRQPIIFGDGEQVRDFIYIDDVVNAVVILSEECSDQIVDVGSGRQTSFNDIVKEITKHTEGGVEPQYVDAPSGYVKETAANPKRLHDFYTPKFDFEEGIRQLVHTLKMGNS